MKKNSLYSLGGIIILLIAAFIFVLVPALGVTSDSRLPEYGRYNGVPIKFEENTEFYNAANSIVQQMEYNGYDFNTEYSMLYYNIAFQQAFSRVVGPMALRDMAQESGWTAPEHAIDRALIDQYYSESGSYSQALYNSVPDEKKREYAEQTAKDLTAAHTYQDLFGSFQKVSGNALYGLKSSQGEVDFLRSLGSKEYEFEYVGFDMRTYPDEEIRAFGEQNKDKFTRYDFSVITVQDKSKANETLKRLNNSEITFDDAIATVSDKSLGNHETGKIVQNWKYQMKEAIEDDADLEKVLSLKANEISPVVKTTGGFAIYRCDGDAKEADLNDSDTFGIANTYLYTREKGHIEDYFTAQAKDFIASATTSNFDAACSKHDKAKASITPFALNYNNTTLIGKSSVEESIPALKGIFTNENFLTTAFALKEGDVSSPIVISSSNTIVVLHCVAIRDNETSDEESERLIKAEIANADADAINASLQKSPKIKNNSGAFMSAFSGGRL